MIFYGKKYLGIKKFLANRLLPHILFEDLHLQKTMILRFYIDYIIKISTLYFYTYAF